LHPREHFDKGLSIDPSGGNTLARGSLSTSETSIAPSPHFGKGLTVDLGGINRTLANTSARGSPSDLGGTNTLARGSPSNSVISTSPPPTLHQCLDLTFGLKIRTRLQHHQAPSTSPLPHLSASTSPSAPLGYLRTKGPPLSSTSTTFNNDFNFAPPTLG
jgi:hypothetical protein